MDTAAVLSSAMTDYVLANGTNKAPATMAPAHIASWLDARGYHLVHLAGAGPVDPGNPDVVARIVTLIDWGAGAHEDGRRAIVRQVLASLADPSVPRTDTRRAA